MCRSRSRGAQYTSASATWTNFRAVAGSVPLTCGSVARGMERDSCLWVGGRGGVFQRFDIGDRRGKEQFLQGAAVVEAMLNFRDQGFRQIERKAFSLDMSRKQPTV